MCHLLLETFHTLRSPRCLLFCIPNSWAFSLLACVLAPWLFDFGFCVFEAGPCDLVQPYTCNLVLPVLEQSAYILETLFPFPSISRESPILMWLLSVTSTSDVYSGHVRTDHLLWPCLLWVKCSKHFPFTLEPCLSDRVLQARTAS